MPTDKVHIDVSLVSDAERHLSAGSRMDVIEGCGHFKIGGELREVGEKNVVYVPSGVEHSVKNDGSANLTLLVMMTPHPNYMTKKA